MKVSGRCPALFGIRSQSPLRRGQARGSGAPECDPAHERNGVHIVWVFTIQKKTTEGHIFFYATECKHPMPADLFDVWGDDFGGGGGGDDGAVSARIGQLAPAPPPPDAPHAETPDATVQLLLAEIAELRREQTRRTALLLVAGFLACASVMSYLDRMHRQLREAVALRTRLA
jgi:hypothetical protein